MTLTIERINKFIESSPVIFLSREVAFCYIAAYLAEHGSGFGSAIVRDLRAASGECLRLSDTVLNEVMNLLEAQGFATSENCKNGRGRPRKVYSLTPTGKEAIAPYVKFWCEYSASQIATSHYVKSGTN